MKKLLAWILIIVSLLSLASCSQSGRGHGLGGEESVKSYNDTEWLNDIHMIEKLPSVDFDVQYIRAGSKNDLSAYPAVRIIRSADEMSRYVSSSDAIKIARDKLQMDYDEVNTSFNAVSGIWTVTMTTKSGDDHETMKVTVDVYGNINDMTTVD